MRRSLAHSFMGIAVLASLQMAAAIRSTAAKTDAGSLDAITSAHRSLVEGGAGGDSAGGAGAPLVAYADANMSKLALDLAAQVRAGGSAQVNAVGPRATFMALQAISVAGKELADELSGKVLGASPSRNTIMNEQGREMNALLLEVRPVPMAAVPDKPDSTIA
mmetsp:Transcript_45408/g.132132  ORF Transcript_45408/g.132132 Transcript_45408/m.132132 type:complete len:163 (-) Transcript_45408:309-797(-)